MEVFCRLLALKTVAAVSNLATALVLANPCIVALIASNAWRDVADPSPPPPVWIQLSRIFVFLDHRTKDGTPTLNPDW